MSARSVVATVLATLVVCTHDWARAESIEVTVEVLAVRSERGRVLVALHEDRRSFPSRWERAVAFAATSAASGSASLTLKLPRAGRYALIVVHDEDNDGRMTKNVLGLPREGYATGRNATSLEFPFFDTAQIDCAAGTRASIRLLYP
ncbi:MAG: hypothetical protein RL341_2540 [Pseudomonadota bacterium]|jgi:uncharacterized protein (DUF2141 family)